MDRAFFDNMFGNLQIPVVVCAAADDLPIAYFNVQAKLLFFPTYSVDQLVSADAVSRGRLADYLMFPSPDAFATFQQALEKAGYISQLQVGIKTFDNQKISCLISGNNVEGPDSMRYYVLYLIEMDVQSDRSADFESGTIAIINSAYMSENIEGTIQTVLDLAGQRVNASRAYIFEEISPISTRNTYEWCAAGVESAIQDLQDLKKSDYNYDVIVESGMYITEDVRRLPKEDREILETQGICALAIITLYDHEKAIGYVGFDDCGSYRHWSHREIQFLRTMSMLISSLIRYRNAEQSVKRSFDILQIITDNSDDLIYVNGLDDYRLRFVSDALAQAFGKTQEEMVGRICWQVLQKDQTGPCDFCPIPKISLEPEQDRSCVYHWETQNTLTKKTYMNRDTIVRWVDGQYVHMETAVDISWRIEHEKQLKYYASTDIMTQVYNREWGMKILERKIQDADSAGSLCFLDVDGLKATNDSFGHHAGDELLVEIVKRLKEMLRDQELICRWGGDEFLLWLKCTAEEARQRLQEVQRHMEQYNQISRKPFVLSFSYGIVLFQPGPGACLDSVVTKADQRMYHDKMEKRHLLKKRRKTDAY